MQKLFLVWVAFLYRALHQSNWSTHTELTPAFFGREALIFIWITAVQFRHLKAASRGGWHGPCCKEVNLGQSTLILTPAFSLPCSLTPGSFQHAWIAVQGLRCETPIFCHAAYPHQQRVWTYQRHLNADYFQNTKRPIWTDWIYYKVLLICKNENGPCVPWNFWSFLKSHFSHPNQVKQSIRKIFSTWSLLIIRKNGNYWNLSEQKCFIFVWTL